MSNQKQNNRPRGPMGRGMRGGGEKAKDFKGTMKKLIRYMASFKIQIFFVAVFAICGTIFNIAGPKILGKATTALSEGLMEKIRGTGSIDFARIGTILLFVLGLYLMSALFSFIQGWIMTGVTQKVCYQLRKEISEKINRMPMKYFVGAVLLEPDCLSTVAEMLPRADYFYQVNNRTIYSAMLDMFTAGQPVDLVTLLEHLREEENFDEGSGKVYLMQLAQLVPSVSNVERYCTIVRDRYDLRMLIQAARGILDDAMEDTGETSLLLDSAEQRIFDIRQGKALKGLERLNEVLFETFERLDRLNSPDKDLYRGIPTGIRELDNTITGLNRSDLVIIGARPGMGKTSFALNIARHAAITAGKRVAFFSLEMSKEQLASRIISTEALVGGTKLRTGDLTEGEWTRLVEAGDILSKADLYLDDSPGITVPEMKAKVRRLKNVDLVIIDYLQLMNSAKRIDNRVQEISEITRSLKIMAKELNIPVVTLAQLARAGEKRQEHRPVLSDLRDSGSIEQDADIVLFLYRDAYYANESASPEDVDKNSAEVIVAKNRHGDLRSVPLHWQGEFMRFTSQEVVRHES